MSPFTPQPSIPSVYPCFSLCLVVVLYDSRPSVSTEVWLCFPLSTGSGCTAAVISAHIKLQYKTPGCPLLIARLSSCSERYRATKYLQSRFFVSKILILISLCSRNRSAAPRHSLNHNATLSYFFSLCYPVSTLH